MLQRFAIFMIVSVTILAFLAKGDLYGRLQLLPGGALLPELLGGLALVYVVFEGVRERFTYVRAAYWIVFGALCITIVCGILINGVASGPIINGLRNYLRAMPWFLLPAVCLFSEKQVGQQLKWLLLICLLQVPVAIEQRMYSFDVGLSGTGDTTSGTLGDSGVLSIFLVAAVCVVTAFYVRKLLSFWQFLGLFLLLLLPTTINETKVMVVLFPVGFMVSYMCASEPAMRTKRFVAALAILVFFGAIFVAAYNGLISQREYGTSLQDFFSDKEQMERYTSEGHEVGSQGTARRGDAVRVPVEYLLHDPIRFVFGYGIGNVSDSTLGSGFSGAYWKLWGTFLVTAFTRFLLELGMLGVVLILILYWLILQDCLALVRQRDGLFSALAAGWAGVLVLMTVSTFYTQIQVFPALSFLFWYLSGVVAAKRMQLVVTSSKRKAPTNVIAAPFNDVNTLRDGGRVR